MFLCSIHNSKLNRFILAVTIDLPICHGIMYIAPNVQQNWYNSTVWERKSWIFPPFSCRYGSNSSRPKHKVKYVIGNGCFCIKITLRKCSTYQLNEYFHLTCASCIPWKDADFSWFHLLTYLISLLHYFVTLDIDSCLMKR